MLAPLLRALAHLAVQAGAVGDGLSVQLRLVCPFTWVSMRAAGQAISTSVLHAQHCLARRLPRRPHACTPTPWLARPAGPPPCRYFLQPKGAIMEHLEDAVKGSDGELKKLSASKEAIAKAADGLRGELNELIGSLRRR